jgi:hypothetical protein
LILPAAFDSPNGRRITRQIRFGVSKPAGMILQQSLLVLSKLGYVRAGST